MNTATIPALGLPETVAKPRVYRRTLSTGLRVVAIRRPSVPMVEVRMRIPAPLTSARQLARTTVWSETLLKGTAQYDDQQLEQAIGLLGGQLNAGADRDKLLIGGTTLAEHLGDYLELFAQVLTEAAYPTAAVNDERDRLAEHLVMAASSAGTAAAKAIAAKLYGDHVYARVLSEPDEITSVTASGVRTLHHSRVAPDGAVLVLVGDLAPRRALDLAEAALAGWQGTPKATRVPKVRFGAPDAISLTDRPGSVQSAIRFASPALGREDDEYAAQQVANMLFGGYFSSRLVANLREDKGYTYTPRSGIDIGREATTFTIGADVASEVTAAAINEIRYELGRLATTLPSDDELTNAQQFLIGSSLIGLSTQSGLAGTCANLEVAGLGLGWLEQHQRAVAAVTPHDVREVAARWLNPAQARIAVVGDAALVADDLRALGEIEQ